ncbi:DUF2313 domain-containing protein [Clostridium sp. MCC334]|jgi:hypothetical protein|nr:DUF2313 domain-containing protein [Clostridium sp. MCC334]
MIRQVDLVSYLPPFMKAYKEPVAALDAENPEFYLMWSAVDRVLRNRFIETADEYGLSRYEKMLGIYPSAEDTLESRRSRVRSKWFNKIPYTMKTLLSKLEVLCGDTDFTLTHNFNVGYTLTIQTALEKFGQVEELESILREMLPENIVVESTNNILWDADGFLLFSGGVCVVSIYTLSNDFRETLEVQGTLNTGGGILTVAQHTISNDFKESITAAGDAKAASGLVTVDFFEIKSD